MPIYEYRCQACGHELEKLQRMNDDPLLVCPDCGAAELRRLVSAASFRLKGAGWYETDFKKEGRKNLHDSGESSGGSEAKSESSASSEPKKTAESKKVETKSSGNQSGTA